MQNASLWNRLPLEEKVDELHREVVALMGIVEELSHKNHVCVDAINLVRRNVDGVNKTIHTLERKVSTPDLIY